MGSPGSNKRRQQTANQSPRMQAGLIGACQFTLGAGGMAGAVFSRRPEPGIFGVGMFGLGLTNLANAAFNPDAKPNDVPLLPPDPEVGKAEASLEAAKRAHEEKCEEKCP